MPASEARCRVPSARARTRRIRSALARQKTATRAAAGSRTRRLRPAPAAGEPSPPPAAQIALAEHGAQPIGETAVVDGPERRSEGPPLRRRQADRLRARAIDERKKVTVNASSPSPGSGHHGAPDRVRTGARAFGMPAAASAAGTASPASCAGPVRILRRYDEPSSAPTRYTAAARSWPTGRKSRDHTRTPYSACRHASIRSRSALGSSRTDPPPEPVPHTSDRRR